MKWSSLPRISKHKVVDLVSYSSTKPGHLYAGSLFQVIFSVAALYLVVEYGVKHNG